MHRSFLLVHTLLQDMTQEGITSLVLEWVLGVLFRPGKTFGRAIHELRFGYWWILLTVFTLEVVSAIFAPPLAGDPALSWGFILTNTVLILLVLFDLQSILLLGTARVFGWRISWPEATKWIGLGWALFFIQDVVTFYPGLRGMNTLLLWTDIPFFIWYLISLTLGLRQVSGMPLRRSVLMVLIASVPWQAALFWLNWASLRSLG